MYYIGLLCFGIKCIRVKGGGVEKCGKGFNMWACGSRRESVLVWKYVKHIFVSFGNFFC